MDLRIELKDGSSTTKNKKNSEESIEIRWKRLNTPLVRLNDIIYLKRIVSKIKA